MSSIQETDIKGIACSGRITSKRIAMVFLTETQKSSQKGKCLSIGDRAIAISESDRRGIGYGLR